MVVRREKAGFLTSVLLQTNTEILRYAQDDGCEGIVFARLGECLGGLFFAEDFAHAADLGAYVAELFFHAFVAAIHVVDAVEDAFAIGY